MSYTQFGYSAYAAQSPLVLGSSSSQSPSGGFERGAVSPDEAARLYPRLPAYAPSAPTYPPEETPAFYAPTPLNTSYAMKDGADPWRSISQSASYYYDPTLAAYGYGGLDFNGARRKNVTRDSTSTLKAWLNEHRKNPYPTKGEKIMLAIITKMTLTQVSTWFANARRRLKKENKMTWEPRNKAENSEDKRTDDEDKEDFREEDTKPRIHQDNMTDATDLNMVSHHRSDSTATYRPSIEPQSTHLAPATLHPATMASAYEDNPHLLHHYTPSSHSSSPDLYKPKIWSLADTATSAYAEWTTPRFSSCAVMAPFRLGAGGAGFADTPPQTPPNLKNLALAAPPTVVPSVSAANVYMEPAAYVGGICRSADGLPESQLQEDKMETFSSSHGSGLSQSSSSNQNADCLSEDYDDPAHYSTSSVR